ncbi:MAG: GNAT family N-acetyltransferase [Robiginitomaculum sp.]|nr:MAG: GNAT family N-acetyltransferase [Robiginitomaculum sp.]
MAKMSLRLIPSLKDIPKAQWDRLANPAGQPANPFLRWDFLYALEATQCVDGETGWQSLHLVAEDADGALVGAVPLYLKSHSLGEYVFDHGWAHAYEQAGGRYYPKLQAAVPFTPVPGARLLAQDDDTRTALARALCSVAHEVQASSVHVTFASGGDIKTLSDQGFAHRIDVQYHFQNPGYENYDNFLASLSSRKRKNLRKERARAQQGLEIVHLSGADLASEHWDAFFAFYQDTGQRKWGQPYLTRAFFDHIGQTMAEDILLIMARDNGQWIAGALNFIGGDALYGRYWGCTEQRPNLHFELCYHQAVEAAITRRLARVEAGAQGEHKIARGYVPVLTHSAHWFGDSGLHEAVAAYLDHERAQVEQNVITLDAFTPFRKSAPDLSLPSKGE